MTSSKSLIESGTPSLGEPGADTGMDYVPPNTGVSEPGSKARVLRLNQWLRRFTNRLTPRRIRAGLRRRLLRYLAPTKTQIVICGYPRSGTSLLYNMLSASLCGFSFDSFEQSCFKSVNTYHNHASKLPMDVLRVHNLPKHNGRGKRLFVVVCLRDPRDVVTSIHPNVPDRYFMGYESRWSPRGEYPDYELVLTDEGIRKVYDAIERLRTVSDLTLIFVRYEELVTDPDAVQHRLADQMHVQFSAPFSRFHESPERHAYRYEGSTRALDERLVRENRAVDRSRMGRWRSSEHAQRITEEFSQCPELLAVVRAYGYEGDDDWFEPYRHIA